MKKRKKAYANGSFVKHMRVSDISELLILYFQIYFTSQGIQNHFENLATNAGWKPFWYIMHYRFNYMKKRKKTHKKLINYVII